MSSPGLTKNYTLDNQWRRLGSLYNAEYPTEMKEVNNVAHGCFLYVATKNAKVAFSDTTPSDVQGHVMAAGDSATWEGFMWISRAWFKADVTGESPVLVMTPIFSL